MRAQSISLAGLVLLAAGCRDRGQDVPGGGWVGTPMADRARFQQARPPEAPPAPATIASAAAPATDEAADAGVVVARDGVRFDDPGLDPRASLALLDRAPPATDVATDALLAEAARLAGQGRLEDAMNAVRRAKLRGPEDPAVLLVEGQVLARSGDQRGAVGAFAQVLRQRPDDLEAAYGQALAHLALGENSAAVPLVERLAKARPGDARVQRLLARLAPEPDRLRASAQAAATGDPAALREHGDTLMGAGRTGEAVDFYALAAAKRTEDAELHLRWGTALATLGRLDEAEKVLGRATVLMPERPAAWQNLATVRERRRDTAGAIEAWQGLLEHTPEAARADVRARIARLREGR